MKKEGANDQYGHDNEASAKNEHMDITLHIILIKVQVPEIMKNEEISISYVLLESISNNRRRYLWYEVALNDINCDEDLEFKSVIKCGQINGWPNKIHNSSIFVSLRKVTFWTGSP